MFGPFFRDSKNSETSSHLTLPSSGESAANSVRNCEHSWVQSEAGHRQWHGLRFLNEVKRELKA